MPGLPLLSFTRLSAAIRFWRSHTSSIRPLVPERSFPPPALLGSASYPVPVRRPAASLPASFTPSSRSDALRFASLAVTSLRKDFHPQVDAHAGRTKQKGPPIGGP